MRILLMICLLLFLTPSVTHSKNLFEGDIESGGFGGPFVNFTTINDEFALMVGGFGAWVINHSFALGGGGAGLTTKHTVTDNVKMLDYNIDLGYGGAYLGYIHNPDDIIHFNLGCIIGAGGVGFRETGSFASSNYDNDSFFALVPQGGIELNIVDHFKIDFNLGYRMISGVDERLGIGDAELSGFNAILNFRFGTF